jgi:hypothetical protein
MNEKRDQALLAFSLGELPLLRRLITRVQLRLNSADRERLKQLQRSSLTVADSLALGGAIGFHANLAIKLRRLAIIDLFVGIGFALLLIGGGFYSWTQFGKDSGGVDPGCEVPAATATGTAGTAGSVGHPYAGPRPMVGPKPTAK